MKNINRQKGSSTLEIMITFAVLIICMSAVILVVFGNQSVSVDTQTNNEGLYKTQAILENARATSRQDFISVVSTSTISTSTIPYTQTLSVVDLTQCKKQATSTITWFDSGRPQKIELSTFFTDINLALSLGGDCPTEATTGWKNPGNFNSKDFSPNGIPATGVDVQNKVVFMTGKANAIAKPDFFIFDARNASTTTPPILLHSLDTGDGLNAVDTILSTDGNYYSFVANDDLTLSPLKQLVVIKESKDLSSTPTIIASSTLPGVSGSCPNFCPQGRTVYYFSPYVYVGTHRTGGHELHIFDVSDPTSPVFKGSLEINTNINAIVVQNQIVAGLSRRIAYLATAGNSKDLFVLDVTDPMNPTIATSTNVGGTQDAETLYAIGNKIYLGKDRGPGSDFFVINVSNPFNPSVIGSADIPMQSGTAIRGIRVIGDLAFIGNTDSNDPFQVWYIKDPLNITRWDTTHYNFSQQTIGLDYEADRIYTANESNDALRIIYSQ